MGMGKNEKPGNGEKFNRNFFSLIFTLMHIFTLFILQNIFTNCERKTSVNSSTNIKQKFKQTVKCQGKGKLNCQIFDHGRGKIESWGWGKHGDGENPEVGDGDGDPRGNGELLIPITALSSSFASSGGKIAPIRVSHFY